MTKNLIVYNASAGSGKTFVLAIEYIALCMSSEDDRYFRRILAITFTNKAAHELKERIINFLSDLASDNPDIVKMKELRERIPLTEEEIKKRAKRIHEAMLHNYGEIHVSTIDSFVLGILRAFSKELGMAFDFDVELDGERVKDLLVDSIMSQIGKDRFITEQLALLVTQNLDDGRAWDPKRDMKEAIDHLMDEESIAFREELASLGEIELHKQLNDLATKRNGLWKSITDAQETVRNGMAERGFDKSHFLSGTRGFITFAFKNFRTDTSPSPAQIGKIEEGKFASPGAKKLGLGDAIQAFGSSIVTPNFWKVLESLSEFRLVNNLYRNRLSLVLALRLQNLLKKFEDDEGLSVIKDNNFKIAALIQDNPTPFIYERVGERYQHFLIDEFQDTSILQWGNMLPLVDASLSYGKKNFLVGDVKQSIYRWRGGEADQMIDLPDVPGSKDSLLLRQIEQNLDMNLLREKLEENYRSSRAVVSFNNDLFKFLSTSLPDRYQKIYANVKQEVHRTSDGFVELRALERNSKLADVLAPMMEVLRRAESDGYRGSDICILTRSNADGRLIAKHLESFGYSISSPDSLLLSGHSDIHMLMGFIHVLSSQEAMDAELYITHRLLVRAQRVDEYHSWVSRTKDHRSSIARLKELTSTLGLTWSVEHYQDKDAYHCLDILVKELILDPNDAYIQELMSTALSYIQNKDSTLIGFYEHWKNKEGSLAVKAGADRNSIQLMTIHKSKGLQFPVVVIPYLNWSTGRRSKKKEWIRMKDEALDIGLLSINKSLEDSPYSDILETEQHKSLLDDLNVLYVASTRAEDRMYIQVIDPGKQGLALSLLSFMKNRSKDPACYQIGAESVRATEAAPEESSTQLESYERQERGDVLSLALSKDDTVARKRAIGQILHQALEKSSTLEDAKTLLDRMMPESEYPAQDKQVVLDSIQKVFSIEEEHGWLDPKLRLRKEIEVLSEDGQVYRMDKVLIDDASQLVIVIDYKTGQEDDKNVKQMQTYLGLIREMGWQRVEGYLLYTESGKVEVV